MGVEFVDEQIGRFGGALDGFGPAVWYTTDGGETFVQQVEDPFSLPSIVFDMTTDQNTTVVGGLGAWWGLLGPGASFTKDNGETWALSEDQVFLAAAYQSVESADGVIFCTGTWFNVSLEGYGVSVSYDGGENYEFYDWEIAGPPGYAYPETPRYGSFLSSEVGFIAGGHWPASSEQDILKRENANWQLTKYLRLPVERAPLEQPQFTGYRAVVAKTIDGGRTWELLYDDESTYYFNQISMINETHGCAVAEGEGAFVLCTSDGAHTWDITLSIEGGSLVAIQFVDESYVIVGGAEVTGSFGAAFWASNDGGRTWTKMDVEGGEGHFVFNLDLPTKNTGYAIALNLGNSSSTLKLVQ